MTNRVAFVDRAHDYPIPAFLRLARKTDTSHGVKIRGADLSLADQLEYARTVDATLNASWPADYRGFPMSDVRASYPILTLLNQLPSRRRREILDATGADREATVALSSLPATDIERFTNAYRALSPRDPFYLRPDLAAIYGACEVRFSSGTAQGNKSRSLKVVVKPMTAVPEMERFETFEDGLIAALPR